MVPVRERNDISIIRPLGYQQSRSCGYCEKGSGNSSYYASSSRMSIEHYQALIDRGWRRSGHTYYKPDLTRSCCPHYTIRLDVEKFKASKSQRQAANRWNQYVLGAEYTSKAGKLRSPSSRDQKKRSKNEFSLQEAVHAAEYSNVPRLFDPEEGQALEPAHRFEVNLESGSFSDEKYRVFLRYQIAVHHDPKSRWEKEAFERFLCKGIDQKIIKTKGVTRKLGSYHQCYRLDGKLIAVAVLDLMPHGVSSVYLFYDPAFEKWRLGTLSALREIALAQEGRYHHYYMGYYIPTCPKMRYKATFRPTYILDLESLKWNLLDEDLNHKIDSHHYYSPSVREKSITKGTEFESSSVIDQAHIEQKARSDIDYTSLELEDETAVANAADEAATAETSPRPNAPSDDDDDDDNDNDDNDNDIKNGDDNDATSYPPGSLFQYSFPGVLTEQQIRDQLNLDKWKLLVRQDLIDMEDLQGWAESEMTNPQSLKGIVAELAAALGPDVVNGGSAVDLFGV